jgi:hypothetical protein
MRRTDRITDEVLGEVFENIFNLSNSFATAEQLVGELCVECEYLLFWLHKLSDTLKISRRLGLLLFLDAPSPPTSQGRCQQCI